MVTGNHIPGKNHILKKITQCFTHIASTLCAWGKNSFSVAKGLYTKILPRLKDLWTEKTKQIAFNIAASVGIIFMVCVIFACTCSIGCQISVNDQVIGVAKSKAEYEALVSAINKEIAYVSNDEFTPLSEPKFATRIIAKNQYTPNRELAERLKATAKDMIPAYSVFVDGEIVFALPNERAAVSVLTNYKDSFVKEKENATASFCQDVTVARCFVPKSALKTEESAALALQKGRFQTYEVKEGEALSDICAAYSISLEDLLQNNVIKNINQPEVDFLKIPTGKPLVLVKTEETVSMQEVVPYSTIEEKDASLYEGSTIVTQQGTDGLKVVDAIVTTINGVETGRSVLSENILVAAVDQVVKKGTKELPKASGTGMATPAAGVLTSRFGSRWGRNHNGIDMSASVGTAIYAADNGTVTYSEYNNGGYGYMMKIDHGNGLETCYAHCSELLVPAGTVVAKGDIIAKVGNTGRSTGAHLHFEVRLNGTPIDPMTYLSGLN